MKLTKRLTIVISILGGLSVLIFGALAVPTVMSIRGLQSEIAEEYLNIEQRYILRRHTRSSLDALEKLEPTLDKLSNTVIIEGRELDFISSLEQAASLSGIDQELALETVNQKDISPWEKDVPIRIRAVGDYSSILAYLERIHALPYYIVINSLYINTPATRNKNPFNPTQIQAEIRGSIRWFAKTHPILARINLSDYENLLNNDSE